MTNNDLWRWKKFSKLLILWKIFELPCYKRHWIIYVNSLSIKIEKVLSNEEAKSIYSKTTGKKYSISVNKLV